MKPPKDIAFDTSWSRILLLIVVVGVVHLMGGEGTPAMSDSPLSSPPPWLSGAPSSFALPLMDALRLNHSKPMPNLATPLREIWRAFHQSPIEMMPQAEKYELTIEDGRVLVTLIMLDEDSAEAALAALPTMGGELTAHYEKWIDARVPIAKLVEIANLAGVSLVDRPTAVMPLQAGRTAEDVRVQAGLHTTEGAARSNAQAWHAAGLAGNGVRIAILDSFRYAYYSILQGELPPNIAIYPPGGGLDDRSDHGTAVAEIAYDMAPGAAYTFASLPRGTCTEMAQYLVGLAQAGHHIISSSIGSLQCGAGDGNRRDDPIAAGASIALNTYGTLFVQAAGNHSQKHWDGTFANPSGSPWHEFAPGGLINLLFGPTPQGYIPKGFPIQIYLRWNSWPVTDQDYDLYLLRWDGVSWHVVSASTNAQTGTQPPIESIQSAAPFDGYYGVAIYNYAASGGHVLDLINFYSDLRYRVPPRSLVGPATSDSVFAVAAVDVHSLALEGYSSWGPTHGPGGSLTGGLPQPLIAGFANVDTWIQSVQGFSPFNGTSAATPHVSGAAALVWGANPCLSAVQVANVLLSRAVDSGPPGYDYQYGAGILSLGPPTTDLCSRVGQLGSGR
jgi:subtilisin family serine protease